MIPPITLVRPPQGRTGATPLWSGEMLRLFCLRDTLSISHILDSVKLHTLTPTFYVCPPMVKHLTNRDQLTTPLTIPYGR